MFHFHAKMQRSGLPMILAEKGPRAISTQNNKLCFQLLRAGLPLSAVLFHRSSFWAIFLPDDRVSTPSQAPPPHPPTPLCSHPNGPSNKCPACLTLSRPASWRIPKGFASKPKIASVCFNVHFNCDHVVTSA